MTDQQYEFAVCCHFADSGPPLLDGKRFATRPGAEYEAARIRVQYPAKAEPEQGDLVRAEVVRRVVGPWEPVAGDDR